MMFFTVYGFVCGWERDASIIGIIVGTMAVGQYRQALQRVKTIIKLSGRKSYMFLIGKINPAKLLNFPEIDVFVLVACPENSLLDSKTLFKPGKNWIVLI